MNVRICLLLAAVTPLFAQFTPVNTPTGSYTSSTTLIPITGSNGASVASITNGVQTVTFSTNLDIHTVPSGGWATWGAPPNTESATPRVVGTYSALTSLTLTLSAPSYTVGFEVEPSSFVSPTYSITATFMSGATTLGSVTRSVAGNAGALLAAASSGTPITSVVLTIPAAAQGFAIAQFRYATTNPFVTVPVLSTTGVCGLGMLLAAAGAMLARKQQLV
jgi:hypothetical protein